MPKMKSKILIFYYASKIDIIMPNYVQYVNACKIILQSHGTNKISFLPSLHHNGKEHPYRNHEKCVTVFNGNRAARMAGICPGCGFRTTRDIVFRHSYLSIGRKSVKPVSLVGFNFCLCTNLFLLKTSSKFMYKTNKTKTLYSAIH